ncbi:MAG: hypothetical protein U0136_08145 [Bdellovibrionota bacterium]
MTTIRNIKLLSGLLSGALAVILTFASEGAAAPALGDYDGDGLSDLAVALVKKDQSSTDFTVRYTSSGASQNHHFNIPGDALVTGKYFGDGKTYPGIVWVRDAEKPLEWYIKTPSGGEVSLKYGLPGDTVPNQADLDCDGITDFAVVRNGTGSASGYLVWNVALSSQPGAVVQSLFGVKGDRPAAIDLDGDGCAEQVALRAGFYWFGKKLFGTSISQVQWGLPGDIPLLPQDIDADGVADYLIARVSGGAQQIYAKMSSAPFDIFPAGLGSSIPMAGNFIGAISFAWAQRDAGAYGFLKFDRTPLVFAFGTKSHAIIRPDGTVIQPSDFPTFGSGSTPPSSGGGSGDAHCDETRKNRDGGGGFKWNAENSKRTSKVMPTSDLTGNIAAIRYYDSGANLFDRLSFGGYEYGNRERWYGKKSLTSYPDDGYVVVETKSGKQVCWQIPDPQRNWD